MTKVRNNYTKEVVYFRFFVTKQFDDCFWYTRTTDNFGFEMGFTKNFTPLKKSWKEIRNETTKMG